MIIPHLTQHDSSFLSKYNTGLGNALFQIFTGYGLAKTYNKKFNNIDLKKLIIKLKNNFNLDYENTIYRNLKFYEEDINNINYINSIDDINNNSNYKKLHSIHECSGHSSLSRNIIEFVKNNNENTIYLVGYLQSHLYFNDYYNEICELIKPDSNSYDFIKTKYPNLFDNNVINISMHIRMNWGCNIKYNENFTYFIEAINHIKKSILNNISDNVTENINKKIIINIFSDDIHQLKNKFKFTDNECIFYLDNFDYIDLWCMSLCNHNIISHSTLSWWGAYINKFPNKIIIFPKDVLRMHCATVHNSPVHLERLTEHYKPEWIGLDTKNVIYQ